MSRCRTSRASSNFDTSIVVVVALNFVDATILARTTLHLCPSYSFCPSRPSCPGRNSRGHQRPRFLGRHSCLSSLSPVSDLFTSGRACDPGEEASSEGRAGSHGLLWDPEAEKKDNPGLPGEEQGTNTRGDAAGAQGDE